MPQGKLKSKTKLPGNVKSKKSGKKGKAVTQRASKWSLHLKLGFLQFIYFADHPIQPKKKGMVEAKKLKQIVHKTVNKSVEEEIRAIASQESKNLSKAQQAIAEHNRKGAPGST